MKTGSLSALIASLSTAISKPSVGDPLHAWQWGQSLCCGTRIRYEFSASLAQPKRCFPPSFPNGYLGFFAGSPHHKHPSPTPSPSVTPTPTPTPAPTATPLPSPTPNPTPTPTVTLAWNADATTGDVNTDAAGYYLKVGFASGQETMVIDVHNVSVWTLSLNPATTVSV